jgi:hypothetical protein
MGLAVLDAPVTQSGTYTVKTHILSLGGDAARLTVSSGRPSSRQSAAGAGFLPDVAQ